jgi:NADPH:quinone reductase-like Zn-dependent oxidoreductase
MQALMMTQYGDITSSLAIQTVPTPSITPSQVLIKVHVSSINPFDYKVLRGDFKAFKKINFPQGIGRDVSGVVVKVGSNVQRLKVGDEVFSRIDDELVGTIADFVASEEEHTALKPSLLSHQSAGSIPLAGLTALQALVSTANLQANQKVLIHAGSGGVGSIAIQLAKSLGAFVATTTSSANLELVKSLGADQVIDYKRQDYVQELSDFDLVFDTLGGDYTLDAFKVIKQGGQVVSVSGEVDDTLARQLGLNFIIRQLLSFKARHITRAAAQKKATYRMILMNPDAAQLAHLADLYVQAKIKPVIDRSYTFSDSVKALSYLATGRAKGKVIINH